MNTLIINLAATRAVIEDPANWVKGEMAATADNKPVDTDNAEACKFCILGALGRAIPRATSPSVASQRAQTRAAIRDAIFKLHGTHSIAGFNDEDTTKHADVLGVIDFAIETAKQEANNEIAIKE